MWPPRRLRRLSVSVLTAFVLSLLTAIAAPMVAPKTYEQICSAGGMKMIVKAPDGTAEDASATMDCPLCLSLVAPPPVPSSFAQQPQPLGHVLRSIPAARLAAVVAAPLPPRGPPTRS
ncbi:MAG TPA: DUF2946 family protein [Burkholderiaceae bacterium]|nr:DUF2946 family protein [Burkholderiaceae bacterium]